MKKLVLNKKLVFRIFDIVIIFVFIAALIYLLLYFFTGTMLNNNINTTTIIHTNNINNFAEIKNKKLNPGEKVSFEINSPENNLGTVYVNFVPQFTMVPYGKENIIVFKIIEKNGDKLIQENKYRWGEIRTSKNFPFGLNVIPNSKDRTYRIEISSLPGDNKNILQFSSSAPMVWSGYMFSKEEILSSQNSFLEFVYKKIISTIQTASEAGSFQTIFARFQSLLSYFLPFLFYIVYRVSHTKKKKVINERMFYCLLGLIVIGLFNTITSNNFPTEIYLAVLITLVFISHFNSKRFYILSFIFISSTLLLTLFDPSNLMIMDRISFWSYIFLLVALALDIKALKSKNNK